MHSRFSILSAPAARSALHALLFPAFLAALLLLWGCASPSKVSRIMPGLLDMRQAELHFGKPMRSELQADGSTRHEWLLDATEQIPGQYVIERRRMGTDRDGFPRYYEREVWVPSHRAGAFCRIVLVADSQGAVLHGSWEGNTCDRLLRPPGIE